MHVLVITGDRSFKAGHPRFDLQAGAVERLDVFAYQGLFSGPIGFIQVLFVALRGRYDVVSSQEPFFRGLLAWCAARLSGARLNVQVHNDLNAQSIIRQYIARFVLRRADSIRVVSERLKEQVVHHYGCRTAIVMVVPVFVDVERFKRVQRAPDAEPLVLWIGRFENEKDPCGALRVFKQVLKNIPEAKLIMLGAGSLEGMLRYAAAMIHHSSGAVIEFPGFQDIAPYLARAHVVLSTSRAESWGASIVETLAAGVPVVAPDVGVAREAGAVVVPKGNLADAVVETLATKKQGELSLTLPTQEEWVAQWKKSLA